MQIAIEPVDVRHKLLSCVRLLKPLAAQKGVRLDLEVSEQVPAHIVGDPHRLRQVVLNLVGNAVKFTHEGSISLCADVVSDAS